MGIEHFIPTIRFELNQRKNIQRIADKILNVLKHYWDSPFEIPNILNQIANSPLFKKFTDSIAKKLLSDTIIFNNVASSKSFADNMTAVNNRRKFFEQQYYSKSLRIFRNLKNDDVLQEFINNKIDEKSDLFKTIPKDLAETIVPLINKWNVQGLTSKQMSKEKLQGQISDLLDWQVRRIARTETSKTSVDIIEFKAKKCNVPCYVWRASGGGKGDGRTRKSHRGMADVIVFWNDPPAPEDLFPIYGENGKKYKNTLGNYHAGCCPNCRCVPSPLIFKDDLKFPVRVYTNGKIVSMQKPEFDNLYNSRTSQMKAELQREKEQAEQKKANVASANNELESKADKLHSKLKEISFKIEAIEKQNTNTSDVNEIERLQKEIQNYIQQLDTIKTELKQIEKEVTVDSKFVKDAFWDKGAKFFRSRKTKERIYECQGFWEKLRKRAEILLQSWNSKKIRAEEKQKKEYYQTNIKHIEEETKEEEKVPIPIISFKNLPVDVAEECQKCLINLNKEYPNVMKKINSFETFNEQVLRRYRQELLAEKQFKDGLNYKDAKNKTLKESKEGEFKKASLFVFNEKEMGITTEQFSNITLKEWEDNIKNNIENNNTHPKNCYTLKSQIDHEFAHVFDYILDISERKILRKLIDLNSKSIEKELGKYAYDSYKKGNYKEVIAEIWAKYNNNSQTLQELGFLTMVIGEFLKESLKEFEENNK